MTYYRIKNNRIRNNRIRNNEHVLSLEKLSAQERSDNMTQHYNTPLLRQRNKRKRRALA